MPGHFDTHIPHYTILKYSLKFYYLEYNGSYYIPVETPGHNTTIYIYLMVFFKIVFFKLAWSPSLVNARPMAFMSYIYMVIFFKLYSLYLVMDTPRATTLPYRLSGAKKSSMTL